MPARIFRVFFIKLERGGESSEDSFNTIVVSQQSQQQQQPPQQQYLPQPHIVTLEHRKLVRKRTKTFRVRLHNVSMQSCVFVWFQFHASGHYGNRAMAIETRVVVCIVAVLRLGLHFFVTHLRICLCCLLCVCVCVRLISGSCVSVCLQSLDILGEDLWWYATLKLSVPCFC